VSATQWVALLRGVNVGKARRVPMADWRAQLESLGAREVRTLLNSGNAVFRHSARSAATLASQLRAALEAGLGVDVPVIVKRADTFAAIVRDNPLAASGVDASRLLVAFAPDAAALRTLEALHALVSPPEVFVLGEQAGYLACPDGLLASAAGEALLGRAGRAVTTRNWATVQKLQALLAVDR
jgi:uncharacterized protein (DUF1697 family)